MQAPAAQRRAVGLARALQAGALYATAQSPSLDLDELKPVLAAHAAVTAGRQAAAAALREVLRELYPAALRAYPDPADFVPLTILDALPEPGMLTPSPSSRNRDAALVDELAATGVGRRRDRRQRHHRAAGRGRGVPALERQPAARPGRRRDRPAGRRRRPGLRRGRRRAGRQPDRAPDARIATGGLEPARRCPSVPVSPAVARPGPAAEVPVTGSPRRATRASAAAAGVSASRVPDSRASARDPRRHRLRRSQPVPTGRRADRRGSR